MSGDVGMNRVDGPRWGRDWRESILPGQTGSVRFDFGFRFMVRRGHRLFLFSWRGFRVCEEAETEAEAAPVGSASVVSALLACCLSAFSLS